MFGIVNDSYRSCKCVGACPRQLMNKLIKLWAAIRQIPSALLNLPHGVPAPVSVVFTFQPTNGINVPTLKLST